jgi:hypothetical protein
MRFAERRPRLRIDGTPSRRARIAAIREAAHGFTQLGAPVETTDGAWTTSRSQIINRVFGSGGRGELPPADEYWASMESRRRTHDALERSWPTRRAFTPTSQLWRTVEDWNAIGLRDQRAQVLAGEHLFVPRRVARAGAGLQAFDPRHPVRADEGRPAGWPADRGRAGQRGEDVPDRACLPEGVPARRAPALT